MSEQKPTVGRIVHFVPAKEPGVNVEPRAAIITYVHSDTMVNLQVFAQDHADREAGVQTSIELREEPDDGHYWEWPPRA